MAKVRYKDITENYEKLASPGNGTFVRKSLGYEEAVKEYYLIPVEDLLPYKKQARRTFAQEELESLAATIKEYGVRNPLSVIKAEQTGKYYVISGERRLRAAKLAGLQKIPCIIYDNSNETEEVALIENIQRANLHPVELAGAYSSLLDKYNYGDQQRLAHKLGVNKSHISETLKIAELPEDIKAFLLQKNLKSRTILRRLAGAKDLTEMKSILGIAEQGEKTQRRKNVVNLYIVDGKVSADVARYKLTPKQKEDLKSQLLKIAEALG